MTAAHEEFRAAMRERGLVPPAHFVTGEIARCDVDAPRGKGRGDGAYVLFDDGPTAAGGFENHRDGQGWQTWSAKPARRLSRLEQQEQRRRVEQARRMRAAEELQRRNDAAERAAAIWSAGKPCKRHPYLSRKQVEAHGLRVSDDGRLVVPAVDGEGRITTLQFIADTGEKRFLPHGRKTGSRFVVGDDTGDILCIAEGFATAASIHECTGIPVAVAFDCGNLAAVAKLERKRHRDRTILLCADDDRKTEGNPGRTRATKAARAIGGHVALPWVDGELPPDVTDFNDLHVRCGAASVRAAVQRAVSDAGSGGSFEHAVGCFSVDAHGVWFRAHSPRDDAPPSWLSSPFRVEAETSDPVGAQRGRLLHWTDSDGRSHRVAVSMAELERAPNDVFGALADRGVTLATTRQARERLRLYIGAAPTNDRRTCVDRPGWHDGTYVFADGTAVGPHAASTVLQWTSPLPVGALAPRGDVSEWRARVGGRCAGNTRLVFAASVAFAAPLLGLLEEESGGFHLRGGSSTGKTTALRVAASVFGSWERILTWRATANALEGHAQAHNDAVLLLDELSQVTPKEAGEAAYMLANGRGKARASRSGAARGTARRRLVFLSTGEESLAAMMARDGRAPNAGQEVRFAEVDADAGAGMGLFQTLHDAESPGELAERLREATGACYGSVGRAWVRELSERREELRSLAGDMVDEFARIFVADRTGAQVRRVARRFATVAAAGEIATRLGLTGWSGLEAVDACKTVFESWRATTTPGRGPIEEQRIVDRAVAFFEEYGRSRFEHLDRDDNYVVQRRAGFRRNDGTYLVFPEVFIREIAGDFNRTFAAEVLAKRGLLRPGNGAMTRKVRVPSHTNPKRVYVFMPDATTDDTAPCVGVRDEDGADIAEEVGQVGQVGHA